MYIISFNSTHQAIKCDKAFGKNEIDYTVLPTPREIIWPAAAKPPASL